MANRQELLSFLSKEFLKRTVAEWCTELWAVGVPVGPVDAVVEVFADPQVLHREMLQTIPHPPGGCYKAVGIPVKLHGTPGEIRREPPLVGEHTTEVLRELGYSPSYIDRMSQPGVAQSWEVPAS